MLSSTAWCYSFAPSHLPLLNACDCLLVCAGRRHVDCDVVMAEVRETSRKPDEMYPLLERLSPGTRKLEIFARPHNVRPGWVSMGNQLGTSARIIEEGTRPQMLGGGLLVALMLNT
jgi:hypothetical protein